MKTAISIPDQIFAAAEKLAEQLGISRSELYAKAIAKYLREYEGRQITKKLNEIYGDNPDLSELDPILKELQSHTYSEDEW